MMKRRRFLLSAALVGLATTFGALGCSSGTATESTPEGAAADEKAAQEAADFNDKASGKASRVKKAPVDDR